jgi:hypothetical protein
MKNNTYTRSIWVITILILLSACSEKEPKEPAVVESTGNVIVQELELANFERIEVSDMFKVEISQGEEFKVEFELEESLLPFQVIGTRGRVLRIGLESGYSYQYQNAIPRVEVTLPRVTRIEASGMSTIVIHDFKSVTELELVLDGLSSLAGEVEADTIRVDIKGQSGAHLSGSADEVSGSVIDLSTLDLSEFNAAKVSAEADQLSEIRK